MRVWNLSVCLELHIYWRDSGTYQRSFSLQYLSIKKETESVCDWINVLFPLHVQRVWNDLDTHHFPVKVFGKKSLMWPHLLFFQHLANFSYERSIFKTSSKVENGLWKHVDQLFLNMWTAPRCTINDICMYCMTVAVMVLKDTECNMCNCKLGQ